MATLTPAFHADSEKVHSEHSLLNHELQTFNHALEQMERYAEAFGAKAATKLAQFYGKRLATELPSHFRHEENGLFDTIAEVSPELAAFTREMRQQHVRLSDRLQEFLATAEQIQGSTDVTRLQEEGCSFVRELTCHIALEERELSGFL
jgi:hemerythrin-like domain-containing protein